VISRLPRIPAVKLDFAGSPPAGRAEFVHKTHEASVSIRSAFSHIAPLKHAQLALAPEHLDHGPGHSDTTSARLRYETYDSTITQENMSVEIRTHTNTDELGA